MKPNSYRSLLKRLSIRQVASITSLIVLALALPIGLFLTEQTQELRQQASQLPISPPEICPPPPTCQPGYTLITGDPGPNNPNQCTAYQCVPGGPTPSPGQTAVSCTSPQSSSYSTYVGQYSMRLSPYSAIAGGNDAIVGYQWDFEGDGNWDADRFNDHGWIDHTYDTPGTFTPKYRVRGIWGYSETCTIGQTIAILPGNSPTPSPSMPTSPSPSPSPSTSIYDMDGNGYINLLDYGLFITGFISSLNQ